MYVIISLKARTIIVAVVRAVACPNDFSQEMLIL